MILAISPIAADTDQYAADFFGPDHNVAIRHLGGWNTLVNGEVCLIEAPVDQRLQFVMFLEKKFELAGEYLLAIISPEAVKAHLP